MSFGGINRVTANGQYPSTRWACKCNCHWKKKLACAFCGCSNTSGFGGAGA